MPTGWKSRDRTQEFFVEKTDLPWSETGMVDRDDGRPLSLEEVRKQHIQRVLGMCKGNRLRAAQVLGISRTSLYGYLKQDGYEDAVKVRSASNGH